MRLCIDEACKVEGQFYLVRVILYPLWGFLEVQKNKVI